MDSTLKMKYSALGLFTKLMDVNFLALFLSLFRLPFYYELKILFVLWLLSPATKGASYLYRKFVHPQLAKREKVILTFSLPFWSRAYASNQLSVDEILQVCTV